jgi:hypothetical protein
MRNFELGYTGGIIQHELLGAVDKKKETDFLREVESSYLNFRDSMELVKRCQMDESAIPKTEFARELRKRIIKLLKLDNPRNLKFFTAVNSYLDHKHGIDAFMELEAEDGRILRVTFDCTKNTDKGEEGKADVVFLVPSDGIDRKTDKKQFNEVINDVAKRASVVLRQQIRSEYH